MSRYKKEFKMTVLCLQIVSRLVEIRKALNKSGEKMKTNLIDTLFNQIIAMSRQVKRQFSIKTYFFFLCLTWFSVLLISIKGYAQMKNISQASTEQKKIYVQDFYNQFNKDTINSLDTFYTKDVQFADPLGEIKGVQAMKDYYANMYKNVTAIKFEFNEAICEGANCIFFWKMTFSSSKIKGGEPLVSYGNSHIKFTTDGLIHYHRDYFDMGEFIYEHIPVVGYLVRKVKSGLSHEKNK